MASNSVQNLFNFFRLCGKLKCQHVKHNLKSRNWNRWRRVVGSAETVTHSSLQEESTRRYILSHLKRTGWVDHNIPAPETVSGHMYRMAMMSFLFGGKSNPSIDREKCIRMALVHDLAECIVGDLTPSSGVSKEEKHAQEKAAMEHVQSLVPAEVGKEMYDLWQEYEMGQSAEAVIVKDLDKFDMIFQAFEYEQGTRISSGRAENMSGELQQFFDSTEGVFVHPEVRKWVSELHSLREPTLGDRDTAS